LARAPAVLVRDLVLEGNDWIEAVFCSLSSLMALLLRSQRYVVSVSFLVLVFGAVPLDRPLSVKHRGGLNPRVSAMTVRMTPGWPRHHHINIYIDISIQKQNRGTITNTIELLISDMLFIYATLLYRIGQFEMARLRA